MASGQSSACAIRENTYGPSGITATVASFPNSVHSLSVAAEALQTSGPRNTDDRLRECREYKTSRRVDTAHRASLSQTIGVVGHAHPTAAVILYDPIFQGLAVSMRAGEVASTFLSRMAVPVLHYMSKRGSEEPIVMVAPFADAVEERAEVMH